LRKMAEIKTSKELAADIESLKKELSKLNTQRATKTRLENPGNVRKIKRNIARALTKIRMEKIKEVEKKKK